MFVPSDQYVLPCTVELSEEDSRSNNVPHVTWFLESVNNSFVALDDSEFWTREYWNHYCDKVGGYYPDFRNYSGPSRFGCVQQTGGGPASFDCSLRLHESVVGTFKCKVLLETAGGTEKLVGETTTITKGNHS